MRVSPAIAAALAVLGCDSPTSSCSDHDPVGDPFEIVEHPFGWETWQAGHLDDDPCRWLCREAVFELEEAQWFDVRVETCSLHEFAEGSRVQGIVSCQGYNVVPCRGRRPAGWSHPWTPTDSLVATLVRFAVEEGAAAIAFDQLADRLTAWNAPRNLIARCRIAADQERRHHTLMRVEAEARGGVVPHATSVDPLPDRVDLAVLNATDGCVNEAAMALVAHVLSERAPTPSLRRAFAEIAQDETEHAELSWDLHAWFRASSDRPDRALAAALDALPEVLERHASELPAELGLPPMEHAARALAAGLAA